jgi:phosphoserine aminotransferase
MQKYNIKIFSAAKKDLMDIVDNYMVFFIIAGNTVQIRRILYSGRKYEWLL